MARLWTEDVDGEKWLVNPQLLIAGNPGGKKMARRKTGRKRRQPAGLARYWAKRGRKAAPKRRRRATARRRTRRASVSNPPARRYYARSRRRAKRNPGRRAVAHRSTSLMGVSLPPLDAVLYVGAGLVVPPIVAGMITRYLPANLQGSKPVYYGVKAASVIVPSLLVKRFVSARAGNLMLLGGVASFAIDILNETGVIAGIKSAFGLQGSFGQPMLGFYPSLSRRGGLGSYPSLQRGGITAPVTMSRMTSNTPERLNPASRF